MSIVVMCSPVEWPVHVPSTVVEAGCGHQVWLANTSLEVMAQEGARTLCVPCAMKDPEVKKTVAKQGPSMTTAQREELNGVLGVAKTDQTLARFGFKMRDLDEED